MPHTDVIAAVTKLRSEVTRATGLRAQADAQLGVAKQELERIDAQLRALGVNPEQAEQELQVLEAQVAVTVTELDGLVRNEIAAYKTILAAAGAQ